jgi:ammonia channel protein AmtB
MKRPINFVIVIGGVLLLLGWLSFAAGHFLDIPELKTTGSWVLVAAFSIACLPLLLSIAVLLIDKFRR